MVYPDFPVIPAGMGERKKKKKQEAKRTNTRNAHFKTGKETKKT